MPREATLFEKCSGSPADESERDPRLEREGLEQWFALGQDDTSALCDPDAGVPLRWIEGVGWVTE